MAQEELSLEQKKVDTDLWIIAIVSLSFFGIYELFQKQLISIFYDTDISILLRTLFAATFQFGIAGLGITIVCILRKESFKSFGLNTKHLITSILLCAMFFIPNIVYLVVTDNMVNYLPFQEVWTTKELLVSRFPSTVIGILITAIVWGFFEGFNYVVISDKINKRYPTNYLWLDWGAIFCAILCIVIHGAIGLTVESIVEMISIVLIIYGMLLVKKLTGNAWGCVFVFVFLWNAF